MKQNQSIQAQTNLKRTKTSFSSFGHHINDLGKMVASVESFFRYRASEKSYLRFYGLGLGEGTRCPYEMGRVGHLVAP